MPEFRRRILNGGIVEYARCRTSHTVALGDETYCYCTLESAMPFAEYLPYAKREQERAKAARSIVLHFFCDLFTFWHCFFAALCIII